MPDEPVNDFLRLVRALSEAQVEFAVVGGVAAVLYGASSATYDLDIVMPFTPANCERLLAAVSPFHPRLSHTPEKRPVTQSAQELSSFKNLYLATDLGRLDVLGSLTGHSAEEIIRDAETMELGDIQARVVALETLIRVKESLGRPKDRQVAAELRAIADVPKARKS